MKILVADDDTTFQCMIYGLLLKWGHEPVVVGDGLEAWQHLTADEAPRLVLLDWVMPGINGLDLCNRIRSQETPGYTYIIFISANSEPQDAVTALEAGCDDFITKPIRPHELRARINTAQRILALEENLLIRAFHDSLTGLANRTLLAQRFRQTAEAAARNAGMLALLYIDLDNFKAVNDNLGHGVGDSLLKDVAEKLSIGLGESQTLARIGGDEFVLLSSVPDADAAATLASKVRQNLERPLDVNGCRLSTSAAIGISLFPQDGDNLDVLLQKADTAMYEFKRRRLDHGFQFFNPLCNGPDRAFCSQPAFIENNESKWTRPC